MKKERGKRAEETGEEMAVSLYEHNERAYRRAAELMEETGKAAVIHPTGNLTIHLAFRWK